MNQTDFYSYLTNYLPADFISNLKNEMNKPPVKGFVLNYHRLSLENLVKANLNLVQDKKIKYLFRYPSELSLGKSIFHEAGGIYIMDPSGVIISSILEVSNKSKLVLDMCAAPGGKTISYAISHPNDLIIANDYSLKRSLELSKNIERMGLGNVVVTNLEPKEFLKDFSNKFDLIILDAPCSGNGMFRKEKKMEEDWSIEKTNKLLPIQDNLLDIANLLLKDGGNLIYSTCSFLKCEDEDRISHFLNKHPNYILDEFPLEDSYYPCKELKASIHLFPNLFLGEGHFISKLKKKGNLELQTFNTNKAKFNTEYNLYTFKINDISYGLTNFDNSILKLKAISYGVKIFDNSKYAKIPFDNNLSHYLDSTSSISLDFNQAKNYLKGEELTIKTDKLDGPNIVSYLGINLGYVNKKGDKLKNCYPKGLRKSNIEF